MVDIRKNRAKHKLEEGGTVVCIEGNMTGDMIEVLGQYGFDAVWIEAEHGPIDYRDIPDLTRACDLWEMTSVVRVNLNLPGVIYRTLDVGAQSIVVPHVNTAEEARAVVDAAKFYPLGSRGSFTSRHGIGVDDFFAKANDESMIIILIEDIIAIDNLSEIVKVDNIDVFFVATGDLAQSMGYPGQRDRAEVVATAAAAIEQITKAGRVAGTVVSDSNVETAIGNGARFLLTSWPRWLAASANAFLGKVAAAAG